MEYLDYLKDLSKKKPVVGYFDTYMPEEFLLALGIHPVRLLSDELEPYISNSYIQGFCCPYAKNLLEQAFKGRLSFLSGAIFTRYCDSLRGVYEVWKSEKLTPLVEFIRYVQVTRESSAPYLAKEFITVFGRVAKHFGLTLEKEPLKEAIIKVNEKRKILLNLYELRKKGKISSPSEEFYRLVFSSTYLEYADFVKAYKEFFLKNGEKRKREGIRIVVSAAEIDAPIFFRLIDDTGFSVVSDDISSGTRFFKDFVSERGEDVEEMAIDIAKRYILKPPCSVKEPSERRIDELINEVKASEAAGVIFLRTHFCDSEGVEYAFIKKRLESEKIPHIYIETDHRLSNYQQLKTRLEAFSEQIGGIA
ncbi:MAG: phenyllactyl-CoA dehydratase subunit FldC [bacterium]